MVPSVYCKSGGVTSGSTVRNCGDAYIYICGEDNGSGETVWKLDKNLNVLWSYDTGATANRLDVDSSGNVYIAHASDGAGLGGNVVTKLDASGSLVWKSTTYITPPSTTPLGADAWDVAVSPANGDVWLTDTSSYWRFNSSGVQQAFTAGGGGTTGKAGIAVDGSNNAFITEYGLTSLGARTVIEKRAPSGALLASGTGPLTNNNANACDVLVDSDRIRVGGSSSSSGGSPPTILYNATYYPDLSNFGSQASAANTADINHRRIAKGASGNIFWNLDHQVRGGANVDVSNTAVNPTAGMGDGGGFVYTAANVRNDTHTGATATVLRDVFKFDSGNNLISAIDLGAGNELNHLIVSPYG